MHPKFHLFLNPILVLNPKSPSAHLTQNLILFVNPKSPSSHLTRKPNFVVNPIAVVSPRPKSEFRPRPNFAVVSPHPKSEFRRQPKIAVVSPRPKSEIRRQPNLAVFSPPRNPKFVVNKIAVGSPRPKSEIRRQPKIAVGSPHPKSDPRRQPKIAVVSPHRKPNFVVSPKSPSSHLTQNLILGERKLTSPWRQRAQEPPAAGDKRGGRGGGDSPPCFCMSRDGDGFNSVTKTCVGRHMVLINIHVFVSCLDSRGLAPSQRPTDDAPPRQSCMAGRPRPVPPAASERCLQISIPPGHNCSNRSCADDANCSPDGTIFSKLGAEPHLCRGDGPSFRLVAAHGACPLSACPHPTIEAHEEA